MKPKAVVALCFALVMLVMTLSPTAVSADSSQYWYLDSENSVAGYAMEREKPGEQSGTVTIEQGESQIWLADEAALVDVTISGGIWLVKLHTTTSIQAWDLNATIGHYDTSASEFYEFETWRLFRVEGSNHWLEIEFQADPETIPMDQFLALKIINNDDQDHIIDTTFGPGEDRWTKSWVRSPCSDPGYPVPELATGILLGVGLVGLVGYLGVRRYKLLQ